jgi:hypothetical protein
VPHDNGNCPELTFADQLVRISDQDETPVVVLPLGEVARRLGGEIIGPGRILCPGPSRPPDDRSLMVTFPTVEGSRPQ